MTQQNNVATTVRITFLGAAGTVTGSKYLVEADKQKILVDCGLFQGLKELRLRNWERPAFEPKNIDAIVLTHAHIDHTGYLPLVVRYGYRGPIYCTAATAEFLTLLLPDSAHLQFEEARFAERHGTSRHHPPKPLYYAEDVEETLKLIRVMQRDKANTILPGVVVTPTCAGHILGATSLTVDIGGKRITFSGDVGRYNVPILPDPAPLDFGNLLLCESTYGDKLHGAADGETELEAVIKRVVERGGPLVIPAFALGRTQNLLYYLASLERKGRIPVLPVFVDSPMAVDATEIYRRYRHDYDEEAYKLIQQGETPLLTERTTFCHSVDESKKLNSYSGPRIIISASGMATGGRILHHLSHHLPDPEATVLLVGYQAVQTRGQIIQSGATEVKIFGRYVPINAHVESMSGLSAHGDRDELVRWLRSCRGKPELVRVVHGEPAPAASFSSTLQKEFGWNSAPARHLETVEI